MITWTVYLARKAYKQYQKLPKRIQDLTDLALIDLESQGILPTGWDIKKTGKHEYRMRLTYRYRMRYRITETNELVIEVFYLGHRRDAYK